LKTGLRTEEQTQYIIRERSAGVQRTEKCMHHRMQNFNVFGQATAYLDLHDMAALPAVSGPFRDNIYDGGWRPAGLNPIDVFQRIHRNVTQSGVLRAMSWIDRDLPREVILESKNNLQYMRSEEFRVAPGHMYVLRLPGVAERHHDHIRPVKT
jgi:hypothetical protein